MLERSIANGDARDVGAFQSWADRLGLIPLKASEAGTEQLRLSLATGSVKGSALSVPSADEAIVWRMVRWLIIQLSAHPLQSLLKLLIDKHQCPKCAAHVALRGGDDLIDGQFVFIDNAVSARA
jgi:hypothetical protein